MSANTSSSTDQINWLEEMHTLHRGVEILYVVIGYEVTITRDDSPISPKYFGETLSEALNKAISEF